MVVIVDTSPIAIGWAIGQDDTIDKRFAIKFRARIFTEQQQAYPQVKKKHLDAFIALKTEKIT